MRKMCTASRLERHISTFSSVFTCLQPVVGGGALIPFRSKALETESWLHSFRLAFIGIGSSKTEKIPSTAVDLLLFDTATVFSRAYSLWWWGGGGLSPFRSKALETESWLHSFRLAFIGIGSSKTEKKTLNGR